MQEKIIAVDFDGTLCTNEYPNIGEPVQHIIDALLREQKRGARLILWTCRCGEYLDAAIEWCREHGLEFETVNDNPLDKQEQFKNNCRKVFAHEYWDDRAKQITLPDPYREPLWCEECKHFCNVGMDGEGECDVDHQPTWYANSPCHMFEAKGMETATAGEQ